MDINKYNLKTFSKNPSLDKKIKALYLLFDKWAEDMKLDFKATNSAINNWIGIFIQKEEYELAEAFKQKKIQNWKRWRKVRRLASVKLFWRVWRRRFCKLIH